MRLFVDTGAMTALSAPGDPYHARAVDFLRSLPPGTRLATSSLVFAEAVTLMAARYGQDAAIRFAEGFHGSRLWSVVHYADESMERAAQQVCELARSPEERRECTSAGEQVDKARSKVQSACGAASNNKNRCRFEKRPAGFRRAGSA